MKFLITGCNGLLGQNLVRTAPLDAEIMGAGLEDGSCIDGLGAYHSVDIRLREEIQEFILAVRPDWILHTAAMTDVDGCEKQERQCQLINRDAVGWIADLGIPVAHLSTDYVFDGLGGPYREEDAPAPPCVYGRSKWESEKRVLDGSRQSLVVRTMTLWGTGVRLRPSFVEFVRQSLSSGRAIRIVTDQVGNPTLALDLAEAIWKLIATGCSGLYHACGCERISRYDWAVRIAEFYGLDSGLIQSCVTADLNQPARRPLQSGLIIDKLVRDTGYRPRGVMEQLLSAG